MKCLTPECTNEKIRARGLCDRCYYRLVKQVRAGTVKWGELIQQKLATKATNTGGTAGRGVPKNSYGYTPAMVQASPDRLDGGYVNEPRSVTREQFVMHRKITGLPPVNREENENDS